MNKLTKNFEQIIASATALGIIILTMFCMASCVSTQNVHINDIYKHKNLTYIMSVIHL